MLEVPVSLITRTVAELCVRANTHIPPDITRALRRAAAGEARASAAGVLELLAENGALAAREGLPACQDTGMAVIFLEVGQDVHITGGGLADAVNAGVAEGYARGYLRKSVVADPISRVNTGDNTPAVIHAEIVPGGRITITAAPKGFGSENMSAVAMLNPSDGLQGVADFVLDTVKKAGANPCPPIIVGVGVGGTFEKAALLAKKALLRRVGERSLDAAWARREAEWLAAVNALGIGPAGLGGAATALAVHIEAFPTHIAGLPVAVNISCHATRHASAQITADGVIYEDTDDGPQEMRNGQDRSLHRSSIVPENAKRLALPLSAETLAALRAGENILLSGRIYTARDAAHKRMCEMLADGKPMPFEFEGAAVFYAGPSPARPGQVIGSIGPTTAKRMDAYAPELIRRGLRVMIGKGGRVPAVVDAIKKYGGVYFVAVGGAAALMSKCVRAARAAAFEDLGAEAIYELAVEDLPLVVGTDSLGNDVYARKMQKDDVQ